MGKCAPFEWISTEELTNSVNPETLMSILKIILIYFFQSTQMTMQSQCQPWIIELHADTEEGAHGPWLCMSFTLMDITPWSARVAH